MTQKQEDVVTAYIKVYLDEREEKQDKRRRWVDIGYISMFIIYLILACWIAFVTNGVREVNDLKKEAIRELIKKYDTSLENYNQRYGRGHENGTSKK